VFVKVIVKINEELAVRYLVVAFSQAIQYEKSERTVALTFVLSSAE
jgi:hypothetical protein